jgi:hypothetical protein
MATVAQKQELRSIEEVLDVAGIERLGTAD